MKRKNKNKNIFIKSFIFIGFCFTCFIIYKHFLFSEILDSKKNILGGNFEKQIISSKIESFIGDYQISFNQGKKDKNIKAIIVPHAGLYYSGKIANKAYSQIDWNHYDKIVILSTNHSSYEKTYVPEDNSFFLYKQKKYSFQNIESKKLFIKDNSVFTDEHSWAIQMPFIQKSSEKNIYLFLVGTYDDEQKKYILNLIQKDRTLLIVNTDLYHCGKKFDNVCYQPDKINQKTIQNIIDNKPLQKDSVCGTYVMELFRSIFQSMNIKYKEHFYDTSSSKSLNKDSSVGYLSMIFTLKDKIYAGLNQEKKIFKYNLKELVQIPRQTMETYYNFKNKNRIFPETEYDQKFGVFVTIENSKDKKLRGCIGTFSQTNQLEKLISEYTLKSAEQDSRFTEEKKNKIEREELNSLQYKINFIYPPKKIVLDFEKQTFDYKEFIIGEHGITIYISEFESSTYLANVVYQVLSEKYTYTKDSLEKEKLKDSLETKKLKDSLETKKLNDISWNILLKSLKHKHRFNQKIIKVEKYKCMEYDENAKLITLK